MELSNICQAVFAKTLDVCGRVGPDSAARVGTCRFRTRHDDCWCNIGQRRNEPAEERRCGGRSNPLAVNGCGGWICKMLHDSRHFLDRHEITEARRRVDTPRGRVTGPLPRSIMIRSTMRRLLAALTFTLEGELVPRGIPMPQEIDVAPCP